MARALVSWLALLAIALLILSKLAAVAVTLSTPAGKDLADVLANEAAQSSATLPPYALFHAFGNAAKAKVDGAAMRGNQHNSRASVLRDDGLIDKVRTVVGQGVGGSTDVCFRFHTRYFFKPEKSAAAGATVYPAALQLWPYFYQYRGVMDDLAAQTTTQVQHGVLDMDSAALAIAAEASKTLPLELVVLAYNDWDAYADEALAALANFTARTGGDLYSASDASRVTAAAVRQCGRTAAANPEPALAVRWDGLEWVGAAAQPRGLASVSATHALLNINNASAEGAVLQLVGAARMAAFGSGRSPQANAFAQIHRSASPQLYLLTSAHLAPSATLDPPALRVQRGISVTDIHRFVHQHTSHSFLLAGSEAYHVALQLHQRILVLVAHTPLLPAGWWTSLQKGSLPHTRRLHALRQHMPFFLAESAVPIPPVPSQEADARRCVLPLRRLDVRSAAATAYATTARAARVEEQLQTLRWDSTALQMRVVQQRSAVAGDCQWVQPVEVPHPTAKTDLAFYDTVVMGTVAEMLSHLLAGEEEWVARIDTTAAFSAALDHVLQPLASAATRLPPPALVMAVGAASDCASQLQRVRLLLLQHASAATEANTAASPILAVLSPRLTTVQAELEFVADAIAPSELATMIGPAVLPAEAAAQLQALGGRCPLFVVMRETETVYRVDANAPPRPAATAHSLEPVSEEAAAAALLDLRAKAVAAKPQVPTAAAGDAGRGAELAAELRSADYTTPRTAHTWRLVLPAAMEVPLLVMDLPEAAVAKQMPDPLPAGAPTFVLLVEKTCGVCSNYWKAFELLRLTYTRRNGGPRTDAEAARFVLVDLSNGFDASERAAPHLGSDAAAAQQRAHWQRARATLFPHYLDKVEELQVPQLILLNGTQATLTLSTEAYAEWWHWPHAVLRLLAQADAMADVEATKAAMWTVLEADHSRRDAMRRGKR